MENIKILVDGIEKNVYGLFYVYDSKYYFIYTEKEVDESGYVILYMTQVGKETKNTENGPVDTGYMVGVEINNPEDQQKVQTSISYIVEDKKNGTTNPQIQYLPMTMLTNLKIVSKKRFRLLKSIMIDNFKLQFENPTNIEPVIPPVQEEPNVAPVISQPVATPSDNQIVNQSVIPEIPQPIMQPMAQLQPLTTNDNQVNNDTKIDTNHDVNPEVNVIIDYRTKYFEEEEKNKELQAQIEEIKKVIE